MPAPASALATAFLAGLALGENLRAGRLVVGEVVDRDPALGPLPEANLDQLGSGRVASAATARGSGEALRDEPHDGAVRDEAVGHIAGRPGEAADVEQLGGIAHTLELAVLVPVVGELDPHRSLAARVLWRALGGLRL